MSSEPIKACRPRVIAGFGRSGTTWVQDVMATTNSLRTVFEPLHPDVIPDAKRYAHSFREAGDDDSELRDFLWQYFGGRFHSLWADYRVRPDLLVPPLDERGQWHRYRRATRRVLRASKNFSRYRGQRQYENRIVKLVRANMILSWLKSTFDARIVFLIRHPAAVVLSQLKSPAIWKPQSRISRYRSDPRLLDKLNVDTQRLIFSELNELEAITLSWCIENDLALRQANEQDICVVYYEQLLERGMPEWRRILNALELRIVPDSDLISRPSQQTSGEQASDRRLVSQYASWMDRIDDQSAFRIQEVLDVTGTNVYRVDQALPQIHT